MPKNLCYNALMNNEQENLNTNTNENEQAPVMEAAPQGAIVTPEKKSNKGLIAIIIILATLIIASGVVIFILLNPFGDKKTGQGSDDGKKTVVNTENACKERVKTSELTKETAFAFKIAAEKDKNCNIDYFLKDRDLRLAETDANNYTLIDSYSKQTEINEIANYGANPEIGLNISGYLNNNNDDIRISYTTVLKDHYAIVKGDLRGQFDEDKSKLHNGITFDKNYIDQHTVDNDGVISPKIYFKNLDKEWVEKGMLLYLSTTVYLSSAYDYELTESTKEYTFTVNSIGAGIDATKTTENVTRLQLTTYSTSYTIDKATGELEQTRNSKGGFMTINKTWELTSEEETELKKANSLYAQL